MSIEECVFALKVVGIALLPDAVGIWNVNYYAALIACWKASTNFRTHKGETPIVGCILSKDHFYVIIARLGWLSSVVSSEGILGSYYLASPTLGMCKRAVRNLDQSVLFYKLVSWIKPDKNWDSGGNDYFIRLKSSLHFKQWDLGGCYLFKRECSLDFERLETLFMSFNTIYLGFNLEDKVDFKGEGIVMNPPNWIGPNKS
ncbi:hypothetical protein TSUD_401640 [Trifolium subterraneum]|uniref:Uncharacterized protein n=1 Tax=Trifolium subterraneum TaxID=3900 RepID=A0A2Z6NPF5_TRISU|nr:hypothetical protein TSUD_401640 [Trifolium subterraneum]